MIRICLDTYCSNRVDDKYFFYPLNYFRCDRLQTEHEIEKLRTDSKESYERENRNLREARDLAIDERDQVKALFLHLGGKVPVKNDFFSSKIDRIQGHIYAYSFESFCFCY